MMERVDGMGLVNGFEQMSGRIDLVLKRFHSDCCDEHKHK